MNEFDPIPFTQDEQQAIDEMNDEIASLAKMLDDMDALLT